MLTQIDTALLELQILWEMELAMEELDQSYYEYEVPVGLFR